MTSINYSDEIAKHASVNWNVRDEYKGMDYNQLQDICQAEQLPFAVCILNITGELNTGMIIRSASLLGAEKVFVIGRRKYDKRSTVGAQHYIKVERITGLSQLMTIDSNVVLNTITNNGYTPIAIEGPNPYMVPKNVRDVDWKDQNNYRPCLIMGSESDGIPENVLAGCNQVVCVKQLGVLRSFNVSSAAAIVMYEIAMQLGGNDGIA